MKKGNITAELLKNFLVSEQAGLELHDKVLFLHLQKSLQNNSLIITPIESHSAKVFFLQIENSFPEEKSFVLKINDSQKKRLKNELEVILSLTSVQVRVPHAVVCGFGNEVEIAIYEKICGVNLHTHSVSLNTMHKIWNLILGIQSLLLSSKLGSIQPLVENLSTKQGYYEKLRKHMSRVFGELTVKESSFDPVSQHLNSDAMVRSRTIITDRNPSNWILDGSQIYTFDFDLVLGESFLIDFVLFVDDYRLKSHSTREDLIADCISFLSKKNIHISSVDYHYCAVYQNLLQTSFMFPHIEATLFCLKRAQDSAVFLKLTNLEVEIKEIISSLS